MCEAVDPRKQDHTKSERKVSSTNVRQKKKRTNRRGGGVARTSSRFARPSPAADIGGQLPPARRGVSNPPLAPNLLYRSSGPTPPHRPLKTTPSGFPCLLAFSARLHPAVSGLLWVRVCHRVTVVKRDGQVRCRNTTTPALANCTSVRACVGVCVCV